MRDDQEHNHTQYLGATGHGTSEVLRNMFAGDLAAERAATFLDPHGAFVEALLQFAEGHLEEQKDDGRDDEDGPLGPSMIDQGG